MKSMSIKNIDSWELASANQESTGLPMIVWFQSNSRKIKTEATILLQTNCSDIIQLENIVFITIDDSPTLDPINALDEKELKAIIDFIALNKEVLLSYWRCEIDTPELFSSLKKTF